MSVLTRPALATVRHAGIDRLRGLAIVCMIVDHLVLVFAGPDLLRQSVGRVAMPLFFLLAGHLVRRYSSRLLVVIAAGIALPMVVPWIDNPNVLIWYGLGAGILVLFRAADVPAWPLAVIALAHAANGYDTFQIGTGYNGAGLLGLMAVGATLPRSSFDFGSRLPGFFAELGRYPLTVYVAHLLVLQGVVLLVLA